PSASSPEGGGAHYVAMKLKEFCGANTGDVELHAVGHSAGSIFHSYFLPTCHELGVPTFMSAHFLAPAVRVDTFKDRLAPLVGAGKAVTDLSLFTMMKDYEKDDNCAQVYRKSLLYLIFYALEDRRSTPILGLEESLRSDGELKQLFGLAGAASGRGSIVWSVTASDTGVAASTSRSHGGFDDDPPTMNSVVRRVLRKADADSIDEFPRARGVDAVSRPWTEEVDWPEELRPIAPPAQSLAGPAFSFASAAPRFDTPQSPSLRLSPGRGGGRRRALCIGINDYPNPEHRLAGCVADAQMWADTMTRLGFTTSMLLDAQATRGAIDRELHALIDDSRAGDVIVFQYAGHGTHVPDLNGDEEDGQDEAICPVDFADGALYIDDDVAAAFSKIPDGVNMTCFTDCCHSGSNTRFAVGLPLTNAPRANRDERKRYVVATQPIIDAHVNFRRRMGAGRAIGTGGTSLMRDVKFAACLDSEVAWESEVHCEFTLLATRLLNACAIALTYEQFLDQITADFGVNTRQHPLLDCGRDFRSRALLQPIDQPGAAPAADPRASRLPGAVDGALLTSTLASIQQLLSQLAQR
ncbi:MAG: peptidase caspase catalytic subunit p20, partial [Ramlibacter sp.]|nr:peptidase caspase catalytic subunit p20 [Ramlibacter sp.]